MQRAYFLAAPLLLALAGCSSSSPATPAPDAGLGNDAATGDAASDSSALVCDPPPKASKCGIEGSWIRGVVHFDPTHYAAGAKPILRLTLRHKFVLVDGEENVGGRLHVFSSTKITDWSTGTLPFALDMCSLGTAMWSEENGTFNLIASIDENANNNLALATSNETAVEIAKIDPGELTKMVDVDVSCNAPPSCLDIKLDCSDGTKCTTITPMVSCAKRAPGCTSDDEFCN
ncbi:hypothetical protein BH09MYX1_BH09MYX1_14340 [soil metagenome]